MISEITGETTKSLSTKFFILDGQEPVPCDNINEWAAWMEGSEKILALVKKGEAVVLTQFIGVASGEHSELFQTVAFLGKTATFLMNSNTWAGAMEVHARATLLLV